jgi:hypothetical protein
MKSTSQLMQEHNSHTVFPFFKSTYKICKTCGKSPLCMKSFTFLYGILKHVPPIMFCDLLEVQIKMHLDVHFLLILKKKSKMSILLLAKPINMKIPSVTSCYTHTMQ